MEIFLVSVDVSTSEGSETYVRFYLDRVTSQWLFNMLSEVE